jgi:hypothetical protein
MVFVSIYYYFLFLFVEWAKIVHLVLRPLLGLPFQSLTTTTRRGRRRRRNMEQLVE